MHPRHRQLLGISLRAGDAQSLDGQGQRPGSKLHLLHRHAAPQRLTGLLLQLPFQEHRHRKPGDQPEQQHADHGPDHASDPGIGERQGAAVAHGCRRRMDGVAPVSPNSCPGSTAVRYRAPETRNPDKRGLPGSTAGLMLMPSFLAEGVGCLSSLEATDCSRWGPSCGCTAGSAGTGLQDRPVKGTPAIFRRARRARRKQAMKLFNGDGQAHSGGPKRPFCDLKGRREPTNGNMDAARPQALRALGFPLAKRSNGRIETGCL